MNHPLTLGLHDLVEGFDAVLQTLHVLQQPVDALARRRRDGGGQLPFRLLQVAAGRHGVVNQRRQTLRRLLQLRQPLLVRFQVAIQQLKSNK